jgi:hypothetical protein
MAPPGGRYSQEAAQVRTPERHPPQTTRDARAAQPGPS